MKALFAFVALVAFFAFQPPASAKNPPVAHKVNGVWTAVDPNNPLTQDKSENALEILESVNQGSIPLALDVTKGCGHMPSVPEAMRCILENLDAGDIRLSSSDMDILAYGHATPTVREALRALANRKLTAGDIDYRGSLVDYRGVSSVHEALDKLGGPVSASRVIFNEVDVIGFGDYRPRTVEQAVNHLATRPIRASAVTLPDVNVIHYGDTRPRTVEHALAIAIERIYTLEAETAALAARVTAFGIP